MNRLFFVLASYEAYLFRKLGIIYRGALVYYLGIIPREFDRIPLIRVT